MFDLTKSMVEYSTGWQYQKSLTEMIIRSRKENEGTKDSLLLVQHKSVYTLGRGADSSNLKFSVGSPGHPQVYRVERGGDVTWHGPGQVVAYPILDLDGHRRDLHWYHNDTLFFYAFNSFPQ